MPRKPIRHRDDDVVQLMIRMPGWLKNLVAGRADSLDVTMNKWAAGVLYRALLNESGFPEPPPARYPLPTLEESIRIQLRGDSLFEPCGEPAPCARLEAGTSKLQGMEFCNSCHIRVI